MNDPGHRIVDRWWIGALLWLLAVVLMFGTVVYQRRTGPTHPLRGSVETVVGPRDYRLVRSENTGTDARVTVPDPGSEWAGVLHWRRYRTEDPYERVEMRREAFDLLAELPTQPPAGKLEYYAVLSGPSGEQVVPPDRTAVIRFKGAVPAAALVPHILLMFVAVLLGIRTLLEALAGRRGIRWMSWATLTCVGLGGMIMGPVVQKYAFGAAWTGVPFGWDLTDNKTLVMFLCWIAAVAVLGLRRPLTPRGRWATAAAAGVMLAVYLVPHSMFGSELDYDQVDEGVDPSEAIGQG